MNFKEYVQDFPTGDAAPIDNMKKMIAKNPDFPNSSDYEENMMFVMRHGGWMDTELDSAYQVAYANYAEDCNVEVEFSHKLDFIEANKPEHYNDLPADKKRILLDWINSNLEPFRTKGYHSKRSSYRLKHNFEFSEEGFHVSNGQFKGAMLVSGFEPENPEALNWYFPLGKHAGMTVI